VTAPRERLRELLRGPAARDGFRAILSLFASWPPGEDRDDGLREAAVGLAGWPSEARRVDVATRWLFGARSAVEPWAALVRTLEVRRVDQNAHLFTALMRSEHLAALEVLEIRDSSIDLGELARSQHVSALARLLLVEQTIHEREAEAIAASANFARLRALELVETTRAEPFLGAVAALETLGLEASLAGALASLLGRDALLEGLVELGLARNHLQDADAIALAGATRLARLRTLDLRRNDLSAAGRQAVVTAPQFRATRILFD
jgi:hypothetical protein